MEENTKNLIVKYLSGNATDNEKLMVERLLESDKVFSKDFSQVQTAWETAALYENNPQFDTESAWTTFKQKLEGSQQPKVVSLLSRTSFWYKVAASLLLIVSVSVSINYFTNTEGLEAEQATVEQNNNELIEVSTRDGKEIVFLPDGSLVWLSKNSSIVYPSAFSDKDRKVELKGEAFFDISRNEEKPFIINAGETKTRVLGTSFTIRAYENEDKVEIDVVTGKVSFTKSGDNTEGVILTALEKGFYDREYQRVHKHFVADAPEVNELTSIETEKKELAKERMRSKEYLKHSYEWKDNFWKQPVLLGEVYNSARYKTYTDVKLIITYYSEKKQGTVMEQFSLGNLMPGESKKYSKKIKKKGISDIQVKIVDLKTGEKIN